MLNFLASQRCSAGHAWAGGSKADRTTSPSASALEDGGGACSISFPPSAALHSSEEATTPQAATQVLEAAHRSKGGAAARLVSCLCYYALVHRPAHSSAWWVGRGACSIALPPLKGLTPPAPEPASLMFVRQTLALKHGCFATLGRGSFDFGFTV